MSELKVTSISHPSASAAGITLGSDGSVVLPSGFTGGLGTNVVQTVKTDTFSTTSTSYGTVTGLTVTITPSSATSKILLLAQFAISATSSSAGEGGHVRFVGGNTSSYIGDAASNRERSSASFTISVGGAAVNVNTTLVYLDSPATTSPVTYSLEAKSALATCTTVIGRTGSDTDDANFGRMPSSFTAIEVAA